MCDYSGQSPADADLGLLDIARKMEHYGIRTYPAKVGCTALDWKMNAVFHLTAMMYQLTNHLLLLEYLYFGSQNEHSWHILELETQEKVGVLIDCT